MLALLAALALQANPLFTGEVADPSSLGLQLDGLRVKAVTDGSVAARAGLAPKDEITHCDGQAVTTWAELAGLLAKKTDIEFTLKLKGRPATKPAQVVVRLLDVPAVANEDRLIALRTEKGKLDVGGETREYELLAPDGKEQRPLVVLLHGFKSSPFYITAFWAPIARKEAILVAPKAVEGVWLSSKTDEEFVLALVDRVRAKHPVDASRIYVAGHSRGGSFASMLATKRPDLFAAGAAFASTLVSGGADRKPPLMLYIGEKDRTVPLDVAMEAVSGMRDAGHRVVTMVEKGGTREKDFHGLDDRGVAVLWAWLRRQKKE